MKKILILILLIPMVCLARDIKEMKEIIKEDFRNEMINHDEDLVICDVKLAKVGYTTNEYRGTVYVAEEECGHSQLNSNKSFHMHIEAWDSEDFVWRFNGVAYMP